MVDWPTIMFQAIVQIITTIVTVVIIVFGSVFFIKYLFDHFFWKATEAMEKRSVEKRAMERTKDIKNKYGW